MDGVCNTCREFEAQGKLLVQCSGSQHSDLIKDIGSTDKNKKKVARGMLRSFYKAINAALNTPGGGEREREVVIHTENPHLLGKFDMRVDDKLAAMIPDDSFYEENFDRYLHDRNHVIYKVKQRIRRLCTLDFRTKVSFSKGLSDPSQGQMRRFLRNTNMQEVPREVLPQPTFVFAKNTEVKIRAGGADDQNLPFQENVRIQAKPATDKLRPAGDNPDRIDRQLQIWWKQQSLPEFISAFSKLRDGGSIFLGVREQVDVAGRTGKFLCQGIVYNDEERDVLRQNLRNMARRRMKWVPEEMLDMTSQITVNFHDVSNGEPSECVAEVRVNYFQGVCFSKAKGPLAYKNNGSSVTDLSYEEWQAEMT